MKKRIIPIFVPHQGCPNDCIFCNQKKITGVCTTVTPEIVRDIIEECLPTIDEDAEVEIAFFGGSFTAIDMDIQRSLLAVAKEYKDRGIVKDIRMSTRPDCITDEILEMVKSYGTTIIELGVQSLDERVLLDSIRGHNSNVVYKSAEMIKKHGINLGLQMMVGLPSDSEEKCLFTAREFIKMDPFCVRIYPTLVIKETGLERRLESGAYKPFTLEESIGIVKKLLVLYYVNNINVIRVGLQATDDIQLGKDVIDGPYHPAFRELVESEMIRDYIIHIAEENDEKNIALGVNKKNISKAIGNKKSNVKYLKENKGINLKVREEDIDKDTFRLYGEKGLLVEAYVDEINKKLLEIYGL